MISAYRIRGGDDEGRPFVPYERGFVQNVQDPASSVSNRGTRVNRGHPSSSARLGDGDGAAGANRLFSCPNMVGPFFHEDDDGDDDEYDDRAADYYFCTGDKNGYCDRRSGTCFCNEGYAGESCEDCDDATHFELGGVCRPKRTCPNDCSNDAGGRCNYLTGTCECSDHRTGDDCSMSRCSLFHRFCTHCNDYGCLECEGGGGGGGRGRGGGGGLPVAVRAVLAIRSSVQGLQRRRLHLVRGFAAPVHPPIGSEAAGPAPADRRGQEGAERHGPLRESAG